MASDHVSGLFPEGTAIVIGGSGGVGSEICRLLAREGCDVALTYHSNAARAEAAADSVRGLGRRAFVHKLNIEDSEATRMFLDMVGGEAAVHTLVYAAGPLVPLLHLSKVEPALMKKHLMQDTFGFYNVVHYAIPHLRRSRGSIVAVQTSAFFRYATADGLSVVPKAGVNAIMRAVAKEEGRYGIRANGVALGIIEAGQHPELMRLGYIDDKYIEAAAAHTPLKRNGTPVDVAEAVVFLASSRADFISGEVINVDGGYHI